MAKILDINEMLEASRRLELPNHELMEQRIVAAAEQLRQAIQDRLGLEGGSTSSEELELHGVAGSFTGDPTKWPELLADLDEGGDLDA